VADSPILTQLAESLRASIAPAIYWNPDWMAGKGVSGEEYLCRWYAPLLEKGARLPFYLVFDLGLKLWQGAAFHPLEQSSPYAVLLERACAPLLQYEGSDRSAWYLMNLRKHGEGSTSSRYLSNRLLAVPLALESLLSYLCSEFPDQPYLDPAQVRDASRSWARIYALRERLSPQASPYQPASQAAWEAEYLPSLFTARAAYLSARKPRSMEQDLFCLHNTALSVQTLALEQDWSKVQSARRLAQNSRLIELPAAGGEIQGLTYLPRSIAQIVKTQLAMQRRHENLFLQRYYDRKLLYQERVLTGHQPLRLLTVVLVDTRPAMRSILHPARGSKLAVGRAFAAGIIEDLCAAFGDLEDLTLDFAVQFAPDPVDSRPLFFRYEPRYRSLEANSEPLLMRIPNVMHSYFRYFPPQPEPDQPAAEPFAACAGTLAGSIQENFAKYYYISRLTRSQARVEAEYQLGFLLLLGEAGDLLQPGLFLPYQRLPALHKSFSSLHLEEKAAVLKLDKALHRCEVPRDWQDGFLPVMQDLRRQFLGHVIHQMVRFCALA
jgi:hypothetical protein